MQHSKLWPHWHLLQSTWCWMTTNVLPAVRQTTLVTTALIHSATTMKSLATLHKTVQIKFLHLEHHATTTGCAPGHIMATTIGTDHSFLTTDRAVEDTFTSHNHTTDPTMAEALATIEDIHSTTHPTTIAACTLLQLMDALDDILTGTCHTDTTMSHLEHATFPTRIILVVIPYTRTDLLHSTLILLPKGHTQRKHQNCTQEQQLFINPTARRRSPFKIHNQIPPQNQTMTLIL